MILNYEENRLVILVSVVIVNHEGIKFLRNDATVNIKQKNSMLL